jgi:hypothetical protein
LYRCNHTKAQDERTNNLLKRNLEGVMLMLNASTRMNTPVDNKDLPTHVGLDIRGPEVRVGCDEPRPEEVAVTPRGRN